MCSNKTLQYNQRGMLIIYLCDFREACCGDDVDCLGIMPDVSSIQLHHHILPTKGNMFTCVQLILPTFMIYMIKSAYKELIGTMKICSL